MALRLFVILVALATLVCSIETDDIEHKKRGAGKTTGVNTIPTGVQKPDYTYTIYTQNPNTQSNPSSQSYQQVPNTFYPNQANSQYYSPVSNEGTHTNSPQPNTPHQSAAQFVPLNFVPNPGYQAKYQIVPAKSGNGIQLTLVQPSPGYSPQNLHVSQPAVYPQHANQANPHNNQLVTSVFPHGHFNFPNYQPLSIGSPYLSQTPTILLPQLNHPFYNNLLYSNPGQNIYYPTNSQHQYNQNSPTISNEYDKLQSVSQSTSNSKESNDIVAQNSDVVHGDYKNAYTSGRSQTYTKLT